MSMFDQQNKTQNKNNNKKMFIYMSVVCVPECPNACVRIGQSIELESKATNRYTIYLLFIRCQFY